MQIPGRQRQGNIIRGIRNENDVLDAIANLTKATTGYRQTVSALTATDINLRKTLIDLNAKLVAPLQ